MTQLEGKKREKKERGENKGLAHKSCWMGED